MRLVREGARADFGGVDTQSVPGFCTQCLELLHEFWHETLKEPQGVVKDQHLSVTGRAAADADGGYGEAFANQLRDLSRNAFPARS